MGNDRSDNAVVRWLAYGIQLVVSAAMLYAYFTQPPWGSHIPAAAPKAQAAALAPAAPPAHSPPQAAAPPAPTGPESVTAGAPTASSPTGAQLVDGSARLAALPPQFELPPGLAPERGLQINTIWVARAISALFPQLTTIGGYRHDRLPWHPNGLAIDVMIPNHNSPEGRQLGNRIVGLALANSSQWGVIHVIWRKVIYPGVGAPSWMADYGNETLNHFDHVHIATIGGGYPTGQETYYFGMMRPSGG